MDRAVQGGFPGHVPEAGAAIPGAGRENLGRFRILPGDQQLAAGPRHRPLLAGDFADGPAQVALVIESDSGHESERGVRRGGGVPTAAHPDLEGGHVHLVPGEAEEGGAGDRLEERRLLIRWQALGRAGDVAYQPGKFVLRKLTSVDQDALADGNEMGRGKAAHPKAVGPEDRVDNGDGRALSVRARDHHRRKPVFGDGRAPGRAAGCSGFLP